MMCERVDQRSAEVEESARVEESAKVGDVTGAGVLPSAPRRLSAGFLANAWLLAASSVVGLAGCLSAGGEENETLVQFVARFGPDDVEHVVYRTHDRDRGYDEDVRSNEEDVDRDSDEGDMRFDLFKCAKPGETDSNGDGIADGARPFKTKFGRLRAWHPKRSRKLGKTLPPPLDPQSVHHFAVAFFHLRAKRCLVVKTTPLFGDDDPRRDEDGRRDEDRYSDEEDRKRPPWTKCHPATRKILQFKPGDKVVVINQCEARPKGGLSAIAALNNEPGLLSTDILSDGQPASTFFDQCSRRQFCVTVSERDNDPLAWTLELRDSMGNLTPQQPSSDPGFPADNGDGTFTNCFTVKRLDPDTYEATVIARDLVIDPVTMMPISFEDYLSTVQNQTLPSRAEISFPFHVRPKCEVGYYDMQLGQGNPTQVPSIETGDGIPIDVQLPDATELAGLGVLVVQNPENLFYGAEYLANLADIQQAVNNGMILVIHDRRVQGASAILPGGSGFTIVRDVVNNIADIDVQDNTTRVTNGPGGVLNNMSLDNGNRSSHGFTVSGTLPSAAAKILSRPNGTQIVTMCYAFGEGAVVYSTIPLDFYLDPANIVMIMNPPLANFRDVYAPNVVSYAVFGACAPGI